MYVCSSITASCRLRRTISLRSCYLSSSVTTRKIAEWLVLYRNRFSSSTRVSTKPAWIHGGDNVPRISSYSPSVLCRPRRIAAYSSVRHISCTFACTFHEASGASACLYLSVVEASCTSWPLSSDRPYYRSTGKRSRNRFQSEGTLEVV